MTCTPADSRYAMRYHRCGRTADELAEIDRHSIENGVDLWTTSSRA